MVVGVLEIVNQLGQIFDGIDVVMRRRRDQTDARRRVAHLGDPRIDLVAGQLAALARLGSLRHLDLQLSRLRQVIAGHPEPARSDLFDRAVLRVAVGLGNVACRIFAALAGIALAAEAVHRQASASCVSLLMEPVRNAPVLKRLNDLVHRVHFVDGNGWASYFKLIKPRSVAMRSDCRRSAACYSLKGL